MNEQIKLMLIDAANKLWLDIYTGARLNPQGFDSLQAKAMADESVAMFWKSRHEGKLYVEKGTYPEPLE